MASVTPEIRAIYWDIGGVLLTNGWDHEERARVLEQFAIPRDEYESRHEEANDRWERGPNGWYHVAGRWDRGDLNHNGIPDRVERNQAWGDRDRDGVPNVYDRHPDNPYRR